MEAGLEGRQALSAIARAYASVSGEEGEGGVRAEKVRDGEHS